MHDNSLDPLDPVVSGLPGSGIKPNRTNTIPKSHYIIELLDWGSDGGGGSGGGVYVCVWSRLEGFKLSCKSTEKAQRLGVRC